jgi:hypothetical protein
MREAWAGMAQSARVPTTKVAAPARGEDDEREAEGDTLAAGRALAAKYA